MFGLPHFRSLCAMLMLPLLLLSACDNLGEKETSYPQRNDLERDQKRGKITGEGLSLGGSSKEDEAANNPLGVNSFLWRATLDTIAFMPLTSADPFGGVVITDWYEDANSRGERFKVNVLILDRSLRADGVKVSLFKQKRDEVTKEWIDQTVDSSLERKLEDTILTRARELRVKIID